MQTWTVPKRRNERPPARGRLSWDGRLWDRAGNLYEQSDDELSREVVSSLVGDDDVEVAVSVGGGPLRWVEFKQRRSVWTRELEPNFHDQPNWKAPQTAPGQLPFHAELWQRGERRVLLFTDRD